MAIQQQSFVRGALSLKEFLDWSRLGRTKALEEIASGRLSAIKVGRRLLIPMASAEMWLSSQPRVVQGSENSLS
ncbi:DNA-binding protein [Methylobacterium mesophilicum SR1.6/6]|uniref:DNA-binding protein n=1 Tax=Methylobacterium mesophilicum SR1.6/6 TaxID=908290 RepID=A0A6B9FL19_9HYPH|nr:DNA-binding protein [Methylobacterium mesophilicum SR1.6/6]